MQLGAQLSLSLNKFVHKVQWDFTKVWENGKCSSRENDRVNGHQKKSGVNKIVQSKRLFSHVKSHFSKTVCQHDMYCYYLWQHFQAPAGNAEAGLLIEPRTHL